MGLSFRKEDRARVANGEITVTYRLWTRAQVTAGKRYSTGFGIAEVEDVQVIPAGMVSLDDVGPSGCADVAAIWRSAGEHTKTVVMPEMLLHRVQFRMVDGELGPK